MKAFLRLIRPGAEAGLFTTQRRVLRTAVRHQAEVDDFPDGWLLPHRGEGEHCPRCGVGLKTKDVSGRSACFCANCQTK